MVCVEYSNYNNFSCVMQLGVTARDDYRLKNDIQFREIQELNQKVCMKGVVIFCLLMVCDDKCSILLIE